MSDCKYAIQITGNTQEYILSPDGSWLGCLETVDIDRPQANRHLNLDNRQGFSVRLISLQDRKSQLLQRCAPSDAQG